MKSNEELKKDVESELKWEPSLTGTDVVVSVKDGMVTLTGVVDSPLKKESIVWATKQVPGVRAITVLITVKTKKFEYFKEPALEDSENVFLSADNTRDSD